MPPRHHKLSLSSAILINVNIMLGAGLFINTTILAHRAGLAGAASYALIGLIMLPLVYAMMALLTIHPSGGFYTFGSKEINPFAGFIGTWSYATGKLASCVILIHASMLFLQTIFPHLASYNTLYLDAGMIMLFSGLNLLDIRTSSTIQRIFFALKLIPVLFAILAGLYLLYGNPQPVLPFIWDTVPSTLPLVLFAMIGFEAACSLSSRIHNAQHNAPRAIMISYTMVICINVLYQLMISGALGTALSSITDYTHVFPGILSLLTASAQSTQTASNLLHLAIVSSALAGSYGIIFSNTWNWHALAQHNHLIGSSHFCTYNRFHIPWLCVCIQGAICLLYLIVTRASQLPLQQVSVLGVVISYSMSVIALIVANMKRADLSIRPWIAYLALGNCLALLATITSSLLTDGKDALMLFGALSAIGSTMFWYTTQKKI